MAAPVRDWSLDSGERQTAERYEDVKANHRARYDWACDRLGDCPDALILDLFCGNGYGSRRIADRTRATVVGMDGSEAAISQATACYARPWRVSFAHRVFPFDLPANTYDAIVSFESMEHVKDDALMAQAMVDALKPGGLLLMSVPNERKLPHASFRNRFHVRHYTREAIVALFGHAHGLTLEAWYGQNVKDYEAGKRLPDEDMSLLPETEGQSLVFAFRKGVSA
jgi:2-polyprenyl-3-methyl-5-hydroxy-6-metoxy-1,4-benzoquinol methylase